MNEANVTRFPIDPDPETNLREFALMHAESNPIPHTIEEADERRHAFLRNVTADDIVRACKEYVVGQEDELRRVAEYACLWLARYFARKDGASENNLPLLNALHLIGGTASGKTFICRQVFQEYLGFDYRHVSAASITGEGWRGTSVSDILKQAAKDQASSQSSISVLFWDEIDKQAQRDTRNPEPTFNPITDLLVPLETTGTYLMPERDGNLDYPVSLDMNRCIWVFAGAYEGIGKEIVCKRLANETNGAYGLLSDPTVGVIATMSERELRQKISVADLIDYGMPAEFLGRASYVISLNSMEKGDLARIVRGAPHSLEQRYGLLMPKGVNLRVTDSAARYLAQCALDSNLGTRMLNSMLAPMVARLAERARSGNNIKQASVSFSEKKRRLEGVLFDDENLAIERIAL